MIVRTGDTVLQQQASCRAEAGCMYRSPLRCSTSSDSETHGCAPGASPGGDTTTPYDNDGYTASCVHCALGLFGNDGTCAGCPTGSAGSQVARCVPGGTNPATIPACAVPSLVSPATYADKDNNEAACESVVGLAHEPETCTPVDCSAGYVQGTYSNPSTTCNIMCTLTTASSNTQGGVSDETCTPTRTDCSTGYVQGTWNAPSTTCFGNPDAGTCDDGQGGTKPCKCELTNEVAMVPGCVYSDYDAMSSTSHLGATACTDCAPGQFNVNAETAACSDCVRGEYQDTAGQTDCIACPLGSLTSRDQVPNTRAAFGATDCDVCAAGTYAASAADSATTCDACAAGKYSDPAEPACVYSSDVAHLSTCAALTTQATCAGNAHCTYIFAGSACRDCLAGRYSTDSHDRSVCHFCPAGSFSGFSAGADSCTPCPAGESSSDPTTACSACGAGSQVVTRSCVPSAGSPTLAQLDVCAAIVVSGATESDRQASCIDPNSGGDASCTYSEAPTNGNTGGNVCQACVAGQVSTVSTTPCADCVAGQYSTEGTTTCINCEVARYQPADGVGGCIPCADGSETEVQTGGATTCTACGPGQYSDHTTSGGVTTSMVCQDCAEGSVSPGTSGGYAAAACTLCAAGQYMGSTGQTTCISCAAGSITTNSGGAFHSSTGAVGCAVCSAGDWSPVSTTDCAACQPGSVTQLNGAFHDSDGADACVPCAGGRYSSSAVVDCQSCAAGSMTADQDTNPATATFMATGATACVQCFADTDITEQQLLAAQQVEDCEPASRTASQADHDICDGLTLSGTDYTGDAGTDRRNSCEDPGSGGNAICQYTAPGLPSTANPTARELSRGWADLDSDSSTACEACAVGTYVTTLGQQACLDFDECASNPCENGATCGDNPHAHGSSTTHSHSTATFACHCANGYSGEVCQLLDECALDPCTLSMTDAPGQAPTALTGGTTVAGTTGATVTTTENRFQCPVNFVCTDPDTATTDDYTCECPACSDVALTSTTETALTSYFSTHPAISRFVARSANELNQAPDAATCRDPSATGCTDQAALNYDSAAGVDDGSCQAKVYGCMDKRAINYNTNANAYDASGAQGVDTLCHGKYCETPSDCVSIFAHSDVCQALGEYASCDGEADCFAAPGGVVDCSLPSGNPGRLAKPDIQGSCDAADISSVDVFTARTNCEDQSKNTYAGYEMVCRFRPAARALCPSTTDDTDGAEHDGTCTCPGGTTDIVLGTASGNSIDECDPAHPWNQYNGAQQNACEASAHRLCAQSRSDDGFPGRHCTEFRDNSFTCPDQTGSDFTCADSNQYWLDDFTCSCAFDDGLYDSTTVASCGTGVILTDNSVSPAATVTNYQMTLLLAASSTTRAHVCKLISPADPADCVRESL